MDRRSFLATSTAAGALSVLPATALMAQPSGDANLTKAFDQVFAELLRNSPEAATGLGFDKGANADLRHKLDDNRYAAIAEDVARYKQSRATVSAVDPATLSPQGKIDREVVLYDIDSRLGGLDRFGLYSPQQPYRITQQDGVYFDLPDFLDSRHPVKTTDDAEAYLDRLAAHPLRKIAFFNAYSEGWALYAEQLSDELGGYATPVERAGYLQSFLFRAARLVTDTGIHTKRWTHAQATQYFVDTVGFAQPRSQREVERYCVSPGQACSYKIGHAAWLRARDTAKRIAGQRFDIKHFHDVLEVGAMPLSMLERIVEERAKA